MATLGVLMMMMLIVNLSLSQGSTNTTIEYSCTTSGCCLECNCSDSSCNSTYLTITLCETGFDSCGTDEIRNISCSDSNDVSQFCKGKIHIEIECYTILTNQSNTSCTAGTDNNTKNITTPATPVNSTTTEKKTTVSTTTTEKKTTSATPVSTTTTEKKTTSATPASSTPEGSTPEGSTPEGSTVVAIVTSFTILVLIIIALIVMIIFIHWRFRLKVRRERYNINNGRADTSADLAEADNKDSLYSVIEDNTLPPLPPPNRHQPALSKETPAPSQPSHHHGILTSRYTDTELAVGLATQNKQPIESVSLEKGSINLQVDMMDLQPYEQPISLINNNHGGLSGESGTKTTEFTEKCDISTTSKEAGLSAFIPALAGDAVNPYDTVVRIGTDKSTPESVSQVPEKDATDPYDRIDTSTSSNKNSASRVLATDTYDRVERNDTSTATPASALAGDTTDTYNRVNTSTASKETPIPHNFTEFTLHESDYAQLNSGPDYATLDQVKT